MRKTISFLFSIILICSFKSWSQDNDVYTIIKINDIVGDTIDKKEKLKYGLFPQISNYDYNYALCLMQNKKITLRVFSLDSSYTEYDYSANLLLEDNERIFSNNTKIYNEPKKNYKRAIIKVLDVNSNETLRLRRRKTIELKVKDVPDPMIVKIHKLDITEEPALLIKKVSGHSNEMLYTLSQIEYINRISKPGRILKGVCSVSYLSLSILSATVPKKSYVMSSIFGAIGIATLIYRNHKFVIKNSSIEVVYK